ncbi:MAG: hypothetical protein PUE85_01060 [Firmicutes bacterium]|nr:hypothetical protein [Bacillota bacterium]
MNNSNDCSIIFRKAGSGYNKSDVNKYIEDMNIRFDSETKRLKHEIDLLRIENELLKKHNQTVEQPVKEPDTEEIDRLKQEINRLETKLSEMTSESDISSKVGKVLLMAQNEADKIVCRAAEESETTKLEASVMSRLLLERTQRSLFALFDEYFERFSSCTGESSDEFKKIMLELRTKIRDISLHVDENVETIKNEINEML